MIRELTSEEKEFCDFSTGLPVSEAMTFFDTSKVLMMILTGVNKALIETGHLWRDKLHIIEHLNAEGNMDVPVIFMYSNQVPRIEVICFESDWKRLSCLTAVARHNKATTCQTLQRLLSRK